MAKWLIRSIYDIRTCTSAPVLLYAVNPPAVGEYWCQSLSLAVQVYGPDWSQRPGPRFPLAVWDQWNLDVTNNQLTVMSLADRKTAGGRSSRSFFHITQMFLILTMTLLCSGDPDPTGSTPQHFPAVTGRTSHCWSSSGIQIRADPVSGFLRLLHFGADVAHSEANAIRNQMDHFRPLCLCLCHSPRERGGGQGGKWFAWLHVLTCGDVFISLVTLTNECAEWFMVHGRSTGARNIRHKVTGLVILQSNKHLNDDFWQSS